MSTGPITIYDKSALQALSVDQAALLGQFYRIVITPLFYVETMADLEKDVGEGKTPEDVVGLIAAKTANHAPDANGHHSRLVIADLRGADITLDGRPLVVGGRSVKSADGTQGIVFDGAPEAEALHRWQRQEFLEIERNIAKHWRAALANHRIRKFEVKTMFTEENRPRTLKAVKEYSDKFVRQADGPSFQAALDILQVPSAPRAAIFSRWLALGLPSIARMAPYAAHVATVQLFFELAVSVGLISGDRPSNAADMAYLFYLPFCQVFTSSDNLHINTVPLFLRRDQVLVPGAELKTDLKRLDEYFSAQPQDVLDRGVMFFEPPYDGDYVTTKLWKQFLPGWRAREGRPAERPKDPEKEAEIVAKLRAHMESPEGPPIHSDDAAFIAIHRQYPVKMGKWRIVAQEVAERSWESERQKREKKPAEVDKD
jgi:hypothetical protein